MHTKFRKSARGLIVAGVFSASMMGAYTVAQTPETMGCTEAGTPAAEMNAMDHGSIDSGDATPGMEMQQVEFDQMYIDMMLPHHGSIVALAQVAIPLLEDPRLQEIAQNIIDTQTAEQAKLEVLRSEWYGSPEPAPMDDAMMSMMMEAMPGMGAAEEQMQIMDAQWQIQTFCAADNYDLSFIDQVIPHHQMAIDASGFALEQAVHPEIADIAQEVIDAQQAEIDELEMIRTELTGEATPAA
jgi:uncharacterized protein (DUF305 family)